MRHAPGKIQHLARPFHREGLGPDIPVVLVDGILLQFALLQPHQRTIHAYLAHLGTLAAHQAFFADFGDPPFVVIADLAVQIDRAILQILLADTHRTGIDTHAATRARQHLDARKTAARMHHPQAGVAHRDEQHLGRNVHVPGKRQHQHEDTQGDGIGPPGRQVVQFVSEEPPEKVVHGDGEETAAADMCRKALAEQPEREDGPQGIQADGIQQARPRGTAHAEQAGPDAFDHRQSDAGKNQQQEKVHQEEKHRSLQGNLRLGHKEIKENGIVQQVDAFRDEQPNLQVSQDNDHEPTESDAGMHEAQHPVPFP